MCHPQPLVERRFCTPKAQRLMHNNKLFIPFARHTALLEKKHTAKYDVAAKHDIVSKLFNIYISTYPLNIPHFAAKLRSLRCSTGPTAKTLYRNSLYLNIPQTPYTSTPLCLRLGSRPDRRGRLIHAKRGGRRGRDLDQGQRSDFGLQPLNASGQVGWFAARGVVSFQSLDILVYPGGTGCAQMSGHLFYLQCAMFLTLARRY